MRVLIYPSQNQMGGSETLSAPAPLHRATFYSRLLSTYAHLSVRILSSKVILSMPSGLSHIPRAVRLTLRGLSRMAPADNDRTEERECIQGSSPGNNTAVSWSLDAHPPPLVLVSVNTRQICVSGGFPVTDRQAAEADVQVEGRGRVGRGTPVRRELCCALINFATLIRREPGVLRIVASLRQYHNRLLCIMYVS